MTSKEKKLLQVALLAVVSVVMFVVQTYLWPNAGDNKTNKHSEYLYQINVWSEKIHEKFDNIKYSSSYSKLSLYSSEQTVSPEFFMDIQEYHYQIKALLRVLKLQAGVAVNIIQDTKFLVSKVADNDGVEAIKIAREDYETFLNYLESYKKKVDSIENYLPNLTDAFDYKEKNFSDEDKIELSVRQLELLNELYSSDDLFLRHGSDPFEYVREFAMKSEAILTHYDHLISRYNEIVDKEQAYKNSVMLFFMLLATFLAFRKDLIE